MSVYGMVKMKAYAGVTKLKRIYLGVSKIYSAGNVVTYCVDEEITYQEEVDSGSSCLAPTTFIPMKEGWNFVGWRLDDVASEDVLDTKIMEDAPITLYAVFSRVIGVTYDGNSAEGDAPTTLTTQHYNNGNTTSPVVVLTDNTFTKDGSTFACWKIGDAYYTEGAVVAIADSVTATAEWAQTVKEFGCTGTVETFVAPTTGLYELEAYGAQGDKGNSGNNRYDGGLGGYSKGEVYLRKDEEIYVCVGDGGNEVGYAANYNGGGSTTPNVSNQHSGGAGGGATHFAKVTGVLADLANHIAKILMVAGGGGGGGATGKGGTGGGTTGGNGYMSNNGSINTTASGGGQSGDATLFGKGENAISGNNAGGGGGLYGGSAGTDVNGATGAGGGSGYIGGVYNGTTQNGKHTGAGKAVATLKEAGAFDIAFRNAEALNESDGAYYMTKDTYGNGWDVSDANTDKAISKMRVFNPGTKDCNLTLQTSGYKYSFDIEVGASGYYNFIVNVKKNTNGGYTNFYVNDVLVNEEEIDLYSSSSSLVALSLGAVKLNAGVNKITVHPVGASSGTKCSPSLTGFTFTVASGGE